MTKEEHEELDDQRQDQINLEYSGSQIEIISSDIKVNFLKEKYDLVTFESIDLTELSNTEKITIANNGYRQLGRK